MNTKKTNDADPSAISIETALARITALLEPLSDYERKSTDQVGGHILAKDIQAEINVPPFRSAAMDGYAFRHTDAHQSLRVIDTSLAGHPSGDTLKQGECVRIMTGARVPDDADTVVQQENISRQGDTIAIDVIPECSLHVRPIGSDQTEGTTLLKRGDRLSASALAMLSAQGITQVEVFRPVRIGIFSTGDELVSAEQPLSKGQIYDANRPLLHSVLSEKPVEIIDLGVVADNLSDIQAVLAKSGQFDLLVSTGGVSVGDADFVRSALNQLGDIDLWKIAVKPGRPLTFGQLHSGPAFFGLPGNPVSAAITCLLFIFPAIDHLLHRPATKRIEVLAQAANALTKLPGRVEFQRAVLTCSDQGQLQVVTTGLQDSHVLTSLHQANALVVLPSESTGCNVGEWVSVLPLNQFSDSVL
ncbi:MAG: molybdopterin molybdotransferase MoeA [Gammaproteobacteria bacterium]|nr:molybdopterin molybdotransferase MoeA [Gammaproteobacteria bacterium]